MRLPRSLPRPKKPNLFLVRRVTGDSMLPVLPSGTIIIGVGYIKFRPGDVVIFQHNNKEKIKRVKDLSSDKVYLLGDNPVKSTDGRDFGWLERDVVIAKVVWPRKTH